MQILCDFDREPRLAAAARASQREQARGREQSLYLFNRFRSSNEGCELERQIVRNRICIHGSNYFVFCCHTCGCHACGHIQFAKDRAEMRFDGSLAQHQVVGDLLVAQAARE